MSETEKNDVKAMNDFQLRHYCLEAAIRSGERGVHAVTAAQMMHTFLLSGPPTVGTDAEAENPGDRASGAVHYLRPMPTASEVGTEPGAVELSEGGGAVESEADQPAAKVKKPRRIKSKIGVPLTATQIPVWEAIEILSKEEGDVTYLALAEFLDIPEDQKPIMAIGRICFGIKERGLITIEGKGAMAKVQILSEEERPSAEARPKSDGLDELVDDDDGEEDLAEEDLDDEDGAGAEEDVEKEEKPTPLAVVKNPPAPAYYKPAGRDFDVLQVCVNRKVSINAQTTIDFIANTLKIRTNEVRESLRLLEQHKYIALDGVTVTALKNAHGSALAGYIA